VVMRTVRSHRAARGSIASLLLFRVKVMSGSLHQLSQPLCTKSRQARPAQIRATVSAYRGLRPVFADLRPDRRGADGDLVEDWSTESSASVTECHPRKFFLQPLPLGRVSRLSKSIHEQKEPFLLGFFGLKTGFDQIYEHAIRACLPRLGQSAHTPSDTGRNGHALANRPFCFSHVRHITPLCTTLHHSSDWLR